jgi:hypothetical protein
MPYAPSDSNRNTDKHKVDTREFATVNMFDPKILGRNM